MPGSRVGYFRCIEKEKLPPPAPWHSWQSEEWVKEVKLLHPYYGSLLTSLRLCVWLQQCCLRHSRSFCCCHWVLFLLLRIGRDQFQLLRIDRDQLVQPVLSSLLHPWLDLLPLCLAVRSRPTGALPTQFDRFKYLLLLEPLGNPSIFGRPETQHRVGDGGWFCKHLFLAGRQLACQAVICSPINFRHCTVSK